MTGKIKRYVLGTLLVLIPIVLIELGSLLVLTVFSGGGVNKSSIFLTGFAEDHPQGNWFHPFLGHSHPPNTRINVTVPCAYDHDVFIETDAAGHSHVPNAVDDPAIVVAVTGGSTVFGVGSSDNSQTFPSLLQDALRRDGVRANVVNLGARGYTSFQEFLALRQQFLSQKYDIVVSLSGRNDAFHGAFNSDPLVSDSLKAKTLAIREIESGVSWSILSEKLRRFSFTYDLFVRIGERLSGLAQQANGAVGGKNAGVPGALMSRSAVEHYFLMEKLSNRSGSRYFFYLQPTAFQKDVLRPKERKCLDATYAGVPEKEQRMKYFSNYESAFYDSVRNQNKSFYSKDLSHAFNGTDIDAFVDNIHYSDAGSAYLADIVAQDLIRSLGR